MNECAHTHLCFEHVKDYAYTCYNPECIGLPGRQGACPTCLYLHGWRQARNKSLMEEWGNAL